MRVSSGDVLQYSTWVEVLRSLSCTQGWFKTTFRIIFAASAAAAASSCFFAAHALAAKMRIQHGTTPLYARCRASRRARPRAPGRDALRRIQSQRPLSASGSPKHPASDVTATSRHNVLLLVPALWLSLKARCAGPQSDCALSSGKLLCRPESCGVTFVNGR